MPKSSEMASTLHGLGTRKIVHVDMCDMSPEEPRLYERTTAQIAPHIPKDQEEGKWANAEIPLGATG
jgi:hypothetical protein